MEIKKQDSFRHQILKLNNKRFHKVKTSLGLKDAYKFLKENNIVNISQKEYSQIIKRVNRYLVEEFVHYHDIVFPCRMGQLELRQYTTKLEFKNGKIETNRPIDWKKTLELWEKDNSAKENKMLIRFEELELFKIYYNKSKSNYPNQLFYKFNNNRQFKNNFKKII